MPGIKYENVLRVLHSDPELVRLLHEYHGGRAPAGPVVAADGTVTAGDSSQSARPALALNAGHVFVIGTGKDRLAVVCEPLASPPDADTWRTLDAYQAIAAHEHHCPAVVQVIALSLDTDRACRDRIYRTGPLSHMSVGVFGPGDVAEPLPGMADHQWAALAAATGALDLGTDAGQVRMLEAVDAAPAADRARYSRLMLALAPEASVGRLAMVMNTTYKETLVERLLAEGEAKGKADDLLTVLEARGIDVPTDVRYEQILLCTSLTQLTTWLVRALTAHTITDVITEPVPAT